MEFFLYTLCGVISVSMWYMCTYSACSRLRVACEFLFFFVTLVLLLLLKIVVLVKKSCRLEQVKGFSVSSDYFFY